MSVVPLPSLLDRRLVVVTGKGGTGKTSVSAALALAANQLGRKVALVEMGRDEHLPELLAAGSAPVGYEGRELRPGLRVLKIDPYDSLAEYIKLQVGFGPIVNRTIHNKAFRQLLAGTPAWRELVTLGKIWYLEQQTIGRGAKKRPLYDQIVVDAPASGHGMTFLDVPRVAQTAIRSGPLRRHAAMVEALVRDPERTLVLPVALPEELPARETVELVDRVRGFIGAGLDRVVINRVMPRPFPPGHENLAERLGALPSDTPTGRLPGIEELAECVAVRSSRFALNQSFVEEIGRETELPVVCLPSFPEGISGPESLMNLSQSLLVEAGETFVRASAEPGTSEAGTPGSDREERA